MKLHPRYERTNQAELELNQLLGTWLERNDDLSWLEALRIVHHAVSSWFNYALREERHPDDPERKADEAPAERVGGEQ